MIIELFKIIAIIVLAIIAIILLAFLGCCIKLDENGISKDTKKKVFCRLFLTKTKVSANDIKKLLAQDGLVIDNITGFTDESSKVFNSNMKSYIDLKNIFYLDHL